jgi:hypothetical protein
MTRKLFVALLLLGSVTGIVAGCGTTPEPTVLPLTQTPWIIVVTATPGQESLGEAQPTQTPLIFVVTATPGKEQVAEMLPTQTPWIVVATPTSDRRAKPTSTDAQARATASGGATIQPTDTATPGKTAPPKPTRTPAADTSVYPPPSLREPPEGARVPWRSELTLEWDPVGELAEDEYYRVDLHRPSETEGLSEYGDSVLSKEPSAVFRHSFLAAFHPPEVQGDAEVEWWVKVVRKTGEDENGKPVSLDLSAPSGKRTLVFDPKPEDA